MKRFSVLCLLVSLAALVPAGLVPADDAQEAPGCLGEDRSNVPVASNGNVWHIRVPKDFSGEVELHLVRPPDSLMLLHNGEEVTYQASDDGTVRFTVPQDKRAQTDTTVVARWDVSRWENDIQRMEAQASEAPKRPVLFVGSSSIRGWDLPRYFPDLPVLNHGFGGSEYFDAVAYADRIIIPFRPRAIIVYDGDNDIANGKSAEWVLADMKTLICTIKRKLPETPIIVLSIKTSLSRWDKHEEMERANTLMAQYAEKTGLVTFLDVNGPLLDAEGKPDSAYFQKDHLHLNHSGYTVWTTVLRPVLDKALKDASPSN